MRDDQLEHYRRQAIAARDEAIARLGQRLHATNPDGSPNIKAREDAARQLRRVRPSLPHERLQDDGAPETAPVPISDLSSRRAATERRSRPAG